MQRFMGHWRAQVGLAAAALCLAAGCGGERDVCAEVAAHIAECYGVAQSSTASATCDIPRAQALLHASCTELRADPPASKDDGFLCAYIPALPWCGSTAAAAASTCPNTPAPESCEACTRSRNEQIEESGVDDPGVFHATYRGYGGSWKGREESIEHGTGFRLPFSGGADYLTVAWNGSFCFCEGAYTFNLRYDDGMRIRIDGKRAWDDWTHPNVEAGTSFDWCMSEGFHKIKVDYFNHTGGAFARAVWEPAAR